MAAEGKEGGGPSGQRVSGAENTEGNAALASVLPCRQLFILEKRWGSQSRPEQATSRMIGI